MIAVQRLEVAAQYGGKLANYSTSIQGIMASNKINSSYFISIIFISISTMHPS